MSERIMDIKKWEGVKWDSREDRKKVLGALTHFLNAPYKQMKDHASMLRAKMQEFTTTGDFPQTGMIEIMKSFQSQIHFDTGYQEVFDVKDMTGTTQSGYDILDITAGLSFDLKLPGEKVDTYTMSGTKARVYFNYFGGALGWHQIMIDDREYWQMENTAREFRNKAFSQKSQAHYTLIEAVPAAQNVAWQLPVDAAMPNTTRNYTAERDVATINLACQQIFQNCKNKGYALDNPTQTEFLLVFPLELSQRINNALKLHLQAFEGSVNQAVYRWRPIMTDMFVNRNAYYVILPKEKSISVDRMNLTMFEDFDITNLVHTMAGWYRFGGAIGDTQQFQRCAIA